MHPGDWREHFGTWPSRHRPASELALCGRRWRTFMTDKLRRRGAKRWRCFVQLPPSNCLYNPGVFDVRHGISCKCQHTWIMIRLSSSTQDWLAYARHDSARWKQIDTFRLTNVFLSQIRSHNCLRTVCHIQCAKQNAQTSVRVWLTYKSRNFRLSFDAAARRDVIWFYEISEPMSAVGKPWLLPLRASQPSYNQSIWSIIY